MSVISPMKAEDTALQRALVAAAAGEERGFSWLVQTYQREVYQRCVWCLGDESQAQEATQEIFLRLHQVLTDGSFSVGEQAPEAQLRGWLRRVATRLCIDVQRAATARLKKMWRIFSLQSSTPALPSALVRIELQETFQALYQLNETQRAALVMRVFEGLSLAEIADAIGKSVPAVEQLLVRARQHLRQMTQA